MATIVKFYWYHGFSDEAYLFFTELDQEQWGTQVVEIYKNREQCYAGEGEEAGTFLPEAPYPSNEEINSMEEFYIMEILKQEFEEVWKNRKNLYAGNF